MVLPLFTYYESTGTVTPNPGVTQWQDASGDWGAGGNWSDGVPASSQPVIVASGSQNISSGLSQPGVHLLSLGFGAGWTGSIVGTLTVNANTLNIAKTAGTVSLDGLFRRVNIHDTSGDTRHHITAAGTPAVKLDGTIQSLYVYATTGELVIANGLALGPVVAIAKRGRYIRLSIGTGVTAAAGTTLTVRVGGLVALDLQSDIDELIMDRKSYCIVRGNATIGAVTLDTGGRIDHRTSGTLGGPSRVFDGRVWCGSNTNGSFEFDSWTTYPGAVLNLRNGVKAATLTRFETYGGHLVLDDNTLVSLS